jgi:hypothetical protein
VQPLASKKEDGAGERSAQPVLPTAARRDQKQAQQQWGEGAIRGANQRRLDGGDPVLRGGRRYGRRIAHVPVCTLFVPNFNSRHHAYSASL